MAPSLAFARRVGAHSAPGLLEPLLLLPRLLLLSLLLGWDSCEGTTFANVTLSHITLHKKFAWFSMPKIYFSCKRSNETLVMKAPVKSLDITYNMTGHEEWQPVTRLAPFECQECELYEATWFGKGHLTHWNICSDNFTAASHASFLHVEPGFVELNLSCPDCTDASFHHSFVHDVSGQLTIPPEVAPFFWVAIGVASFGAILIIIGSLAYLRHEEAGDEHEKQKFIEMSEEEAALHDLNPDVHEIGELEEEESAIPVLQDKNRHV